jgi:uncharacterized repeat protein (TIGR03803 family)
VLASFDSATTGNSPAGPLLLAADGNYYGVCSAGGTSGAGTVFRVTPAGMLTVLANLDSATTGGYSPLGPLVQAGDGNFYSVTNYGASGGNGTIFRVTPAGVVTAVAAFNYATQGGYPSAGLTLGADGLLYGATGEGGPKDGGTLFKSTLGGQITVLAAFDYTANGSNAGQVLQTPDGSLYVALGSGGPGGSGAIVRYRNDPSPAPAPPATPPATPTIIGKPKVTGNKAMLSGKLATPGAYVEYAVGKPVKFIKAKGGANWKLTLKLKPGKNIFYIRSYDPATGKASAAKKIVINKN